MKPSERHQGKEKETSPRKAGGIKKASTNYEASSAVPISAFFPGTRSGQG